MSRTAKTAKRSLVMRLLAVVGWLALQVVKVMWKVLAFAGSRFAKRKLDETDRRSAQGGHGDAALGRAA